MSENDKTPAAQAGTQGGGPSTPTPTGQPSTTPSSQVGQGPGLDPPSPPDEPEDDEDEAFHERPTRPGFGDEDTGGAAEQRPPADS